MEKKHYICPEIQVCTMVQTSSFLCLSLPKEQNGGDPGEAI